MRPADIGSVNLLSEGNWKTRRPLLRFGVSSSLAVFVVAAAVAGMLVSLSEPSLSLEDIWGLRYVQEVVMVQIAGECISGVENRSGRPVTTGHRSPPNKADFETRLHALPSSFTHIFFEDG